MSKVLRCEICQAVLAHRFVDGQVFYGPWAMMCLNCHARIGCGLGTGKGQKYRINEDGSWTKLSGKVKPKTQAKAEAARLAEALELAQQTIARLVAELEATRVERDSRPVVDPSLESYIEEREAKVRERRERHEHEQQVRYLQGRAELASNDARIAYETGLNPQQVCALQRVAANWAAQARVNHHGKATE